jgi:hypothetical protein
VRAGQRFDEPRRRPEPPRGHDDDKPVRGLGDHVPNFLLRPVRAPRATHVEGVEAED